MEVIFPDWPGAHPPLPDHAPDPRQTILLPYPRAFPDLAQGQRVVLDSGAFGRSFQSGADRQPLDDWLHDLAVWYRAAHGRYGARLRWSVAPDVFGNPRQTEAQWRLWRERVSDLSFSVAPVIQLRPSRPLDLYEIHRQARFYGPQPIIMLSNPAGMTATRWGKMLQAACALIRRSCGANCHIHLLGAGWSPEDVAAYRRVAPALSSLDSIAYYTAARERERWCGCAYCLARGTPWQHAALHASHLLCQYATLVAT